MPQRCLAATEDFHQQIRCGRMAANNHLLTDEKSQLIQRKSSLAPDLSAARQSLFRARFFAASAALIC